MLPTIFTAARFPFPFIFLMDEFANVSLPDDFDKILSVMRSRGGIGKYYLAELGTA